MNNYDYQVLVYSKNPQMIVNCVKGQPFLVEYQLTGNNFAANLHAAVLLLL